MRRRVNNRQTPEASALQHTAGNQGGQNCFCRSSAKIVFIIAKKMQNKSHFFFSIA
jgi:hypothetical protein